MQFDALGTGGIRRLCATVALIDIDQCDAVASGALDRLGKMTDLGTVIDVGWG